MMTYDLSGTWQCTIPGADGQPQTSPMKIPGSLDESRIGYPDLVAGAWHPDAYLNETLEAASVIATRFTRVATYEGPAEITTRVKTDIPAGKRAFLEVERARCLTLLVNGTQVPPYTPPTLITPHVFEVTEFLTGDDTITIISDNSYPGLPHDDIVFSSAATDETQTNWNGLLGYVRIRVEEASFLKSVRVYPHGGTIDVYGEIDGSWNGRLAVTSDCLSEVYVSEPVGGAFELKHIPLKPDVVRWDEGRGSLYELTVSAAASAGAAGCGCPAAAGASEADTAGECGEGLAPVTVSFGVRDFESKDGVLTLNGRRIFLRGETNCAVFPETGYCPMTLEEWNTVLATYQSYGVNCIRFHSHTPPAAAFAAADRFGMLMQCELSNWNPRNSFESDESWAYYRNELRETVLYLANHPSFVMLTFGNELFAGDLGHARMDEMIAMCHAIDPTRLYANASNGHYGQLGCDPESDFYASQTYYDKKIRATCSNMLGYLNQEYPSAAKNYSDVFPEIREKYKKPIFTFEVGQYEVLPDFAELADFCGVTRPDNLALIRDHVEEKGLTERWPAYCAATGEISRLCYREEFEAALRTEELSGISFLSFQDFPGQGTALVGMMNSHLQPKPYPFAEPARFAEFYTGIRPLVLLPKYTYEAGETITAKVRFANYGSEALSGACHYEVTDGSTVVSGDGAVCTAPAGSLIDIGEISCEAGVFALPAKLTIRVSFAGHPAEYAVWAYPAEKPVCPDSVYEARSLTDEALGVLEAGGTVYLSPASDEASLPNSIKAQFSTDFWSVGTFASQSGAMGQLIDEKHPLFAEFPTGFHTDWQWWPMAGQRAVIIPETIRPIITEMDSYAYLRHMAQLFECRCANGRLLFSSLGLQDLQQYPEGRALQRAIYHYLAKPGCVEQEVSPEVIRQIVCPGV